MRLGKPSYYDKFRCIAGACSDSCCVGWEIDVDEKRQDMYRNVPGEIGERLRSCIDWEEGHFILQGKEERCPFLNRDNLCDLIIHLGEDSLCDICREHPRFYDWFAGDYTEVGLGLCCEAAGRLILGEKEKFCLVIDEQEDEACSVDKEDQVNETEQEWDESGIVAEEEAMYFAARDQVFSILQDRKESVWSRLEQLLCYTELLQEMLDGGMSNEMENQYVVNQSRPMPEQKAAIYSGILALCRELEAMDESWPQTLEELQQLISHPEQFAATEAAMLASCREREYEYEQLAVYFIYRYFMKCREDEDVRSKGRLTVFCILLIRLLDTACFARTGSITTEDRVLHAKCCSKEIEYSEENLETLADAFWERDEVSLEKLCMLSNTGYCKK